ncbi:hypothetical protein M2271_008486 [Streptomyces sp. LBL]|nr:hypothetical protein [Streptomyces sp. LBL]
MFSVVNADGTTSDGSSLIDEIAREGARRMLAAALEAEVNFCIAEMVVQQDERGRRLVVRNGYHQPRKVMTAAGTVEVKATRGAAPALPPRPSSGDFVPALEQVLGSAAGLSPATGTRLTPQWRADYEAFGEFRDRLRLGLGR